MKNFQTCIRCGKTIENFSTLVEGELGYDCDRCGLGIRRFSENSAVDTIYWKPENHGVGEVGAWTGVPKGTLLVMSSEKV